MGRKGRLMQGSANFCQGPERKHFGLAVQVASVAITQLSCCSLDCIEREGQSGAEASQAPGTSPTLPHMGFSRQDYWSAMPSSRGSSQPRN